MKIDPLTYPPDSDREACWRGLPKFANVRMLLAGAFVPPRQHSSLILCTTEKCASAYVGRILQELALASSMAPVDLPGYVHDLPPQDELDRLALNMHLACSGKLAHLDAPRTIADKCLATAAQLCMYLPSACQLPWIGTRIETLQTLRSLARFLAPEGCMFGPFRNPAVLDRLTDLSRRKILVMLRDPRDVLTSHYFSVAISHAAPENPLLVPQFQKRRQRCAAIGIDAHVREKTPSFVTRYRKYCEHLQLNPNLLLLRYEEMIADFGQWLDRIIDYWDLPVDQFTRHRFAAMADFDVDRENVHSHKRQVQPGDHRRKLHPDTVHWLTDQFAEVLGILGYSRHGDVSIRRMAA
jgi:hypothetical protein